MGDEWITDFIGDDRQHEDHEIDMIFSLLSDRYTRFAMQYLVDNPSSTLDELSEVVAGWEAAYHHRVVTPSDHDTIRIYLHHVALPRLDRHQLVNFDPEDQVVTEAAIPSFVDELLSTV